MTADGPDAAPFRYVYAPEFAATLAALRATLLVSTYQAGKVMAVRAAGDRLSVLLRSFEQPMGLGYRPGTLAVGTRWAVWFLRDAPGLPAGGEKAGRHDAVFVPRSCHVTGDVRAHEIGWAGDDLWIVNTRFSCLCTLHSEYSFVPRWRPPFVTALAPDDRCHLNGLAIVDDRPRYVTALGATDTPAGWRPTKADGGCLIDVPSGEIVRRGLCMPHSPRVHDGRLWVLNSGTGHLLTVDPRTGRHEVVAEFPGFVRGLALHGRYAFVGLSRIRETSTFGGLPVAARRATLKCGVWAIDLGSGRPCGHLEFEQGIDELFDVRLMAGLRFPAVIGMQKDTFHESFVLPPGGADGPARPDVPRSV